jgi:uncharacterized protein (DUF1800 family)
MLAVLLILPTWAAGALDDNANGMSDVWEAAYGRDLTPDDDTDRDGQSNRNESRAGTDPKSPGSRFAVSDVTIDSANAALTWPSVPGKRYRAEVSTQLRDGSWEPVGPELTSDGANTTLVLPLATTYRTGGPLLSRWLGYTTWDFTVLKNTVATGTPAPAWTIRPSLAEAPSNDGTDYAQWMRGWIIPPTTGNYTFWIASDDFSELWLSANASVGAKQLVAQVTPGNWTDSRQWTKFASQQSAPRFLQADRAYYFEAFQREGAGGDNLAVAWEGPGFAREVIPGNRITTDGDSLAEATAAGAGLYFRIRVSDADSDNDGASDAEELLAGFDPNNPTTTPRIADAESLRAAVAARSVLTVGTPVSRAYEAGPVPGRFTVFRSGGIDPLTIRYTITGNAVAGTDYAALAGTITLPPAGKQVQIDLAPLTDGLVESAETVTLNLTADPAYDLGAPASATVTIDDAPDAIFVAILRGPTGIASGGFGSSVLRKAGNDLFAQLALQFTNLNSGQAGATLFVSSTGDGGTPVLELPPGQVASHRWEFDPVTGATRAEILAALDEGRLWVRVRSASLPGGEIVGRFDRHPAWQVMPVPPAPPALPGGPVSQADAARFLVQATFGPTTDEIARVVSLGYAGWIDDQFTRNATRHLPYVQLRRQQLLASSNNTDDGWQRPRQEAWWEAALTGPDQLRQRMAFALSQIFVISEIGALDGSHEGVTNYYDLLADHAFGNYRDLLEAVTLNPCMGIYLSMLRNRKPDALTGSEPDENYARESMQLLSIGLNRLHPDGSLQLDADGMQLPTYSQNDIVGLARVFTGWGYAYDGTVEPPFFWGPEDLLRPMVQYPAYHDTGAKQIVGGATIPAGQSGEQDLDQALDVLFHHPNVGPFLSRQLIQRFVTSNPSPGYIHRVAQVFNDNGSGVRGDLKAVLKAVLLDYEARSAEPLANTGFGKLREPVLRISHLLRAMHIQPPGTGDPRYFVDLQYSINQAALKSPSVFNFFQPGYIPPGRLAAAGLYGPEFQITSESSAITLTNQLHGTLDWGLWTPEGDGVLRLDLATEHGILFAPVGTEAERRTQLLDHLGLLFLNGRMTPELRSRITSFWDSLDSWFDDDDSDPGTEFAWGRSQQIQIAIYLILASPEYAIQK